MMSPFSSQQLFTNLLHTEETLHSLTYSVLNRCGRHFMLNIRNNISVLCSGSLCSHALLALKAG